MKTFVGTHTRYPDLTGKRQAEGGKRLRGDTRESCPDAPLVTIITVCFNSAKTIEQTFRSVCDQTYENIEYVVVDGASTDGTVDIIKAHEDLIDYYVSEPDNGLYYAMNKGLELAQGEYILILNSDDWYVSDAVEALVAAIGYSGCDFVSGLRKYVNSSEKIINLSPLMNFDYSVYLRAPIHHETMLVPRRVYDQIGPYNTNYKIVGDLDLMIRLFESGISHFKLRKQITFFRQTGISNTDEAALIADRGALLEKEFSFLDREEIAFLADRNRSSGFDLLELASRHSVRLSLVNAIHDYMLDHADRALQGRGPHAHWKPYAKELIEKINTHKADRSPRISVILPVYNAEDTLRRSIDSVLSQSLQDIELICLNDQTPDGSQAIIDEYARKDARVVPIMNEQNIGLGASRNAGIRAARGQYIFHLDPDDTLPPDALKEVHELARRYGSDMTRGAYMHEQFLLGQTEARKQRKGLREDEAHVINTTLQDTPKLLNNTEGHWSYLYRADFAKRVKYPEDLKMGQDSLFIVNAIAQAQSISITDVLVYHYRANPNSAMNTFNFRKFMDSLEWRIRAWRLLRDAGLTAAGEHLLFRYWNAAFFESLTKKLSAEEKSAFDEKLGLALKRAGYPGQNPPDKPEVAKYFDATLKNDGNGQTDLTTDPSALRIATFTTRDSHGAGTGSMRRVEALNQHGVSAELHVLMKKSAEPFVKAIRPKVAARKAKKLKALSAAWREAAVLTRKEQPGLKARELFSKTGSVVDFRDNRAIFDTADVVHLHWVAGIFDYRNVDVLSGKPVVWTLADMNAFTGGCHYSEGCTNYRNDCRNCPLLAEGSDLAHEAWKTKRAAYAKLKNLHIICPSQ
jgi:glycosyltransferase involved in cell wall biosynthesis